MTSDCAAAIRKKVAAVIGGAGITATALAGGHSAYAEIISFENPSPFEFHWTSYTLLDMTLPAADQASAGAYTSFYQYKGWDGLGYGHVVFYGCSSDILIAGDGWRPAALAPGTEIGPDLDFSTWLQAANQDMYPNNHTWLVFVGYGEREFMGVKFDVSGGIHYGWIDVMWDPMEERFDAYAWGYETTPNKPIPAGATEGGDPIPEPGTLAMFTLGAAAAAAVALRRRKKAAGAEEE